MESEREPRRLLDRQGRNHIISVLLRSASLPGSLPFEKEPFGGFSSYFLFLVFSLGASTPLTGQTHAYAHTLTHTLLHTHLHTR